MGMRGLAGKTAIVTGAAGGLGTATVKRLVEEGCNVAAADLNAAPLSELAAQFKGKVLDLPADVRQPEECERMVERAASHFGSVDLLVNNAAVINKHYPVAEMPVEEFDRVHSVNVRGVFLVLRVMLCSMIAQGKGGAIVNISSVAALRANGGISPYGSAKRAVLGLSGAAALENGRYGIRVNSVCPGPIDTPMLRPAINNPPGELEGFFRHLAIPRAARPAEIAAFIAYLLSDDASYCTGGIYPVDGGLTI